jgi:hypothetical protein
LQVLTVDEGHRLKNMECKLIKTLKEYSSDTRLLLTGTPLQVCCPSHIVFYLLSTVYCLCCLLAAGCRLPTCPLSAGCHLLSAFRFDLS